MDLDPATLISGGGMLAFAWAVYSEIRAVRTAIAPALDRISDALSSVEQRLARIEGAAAIDQREDPRSVQRKRARTPRAGLPTVEE